MTGNDLRRRIAALRRERCDLVLSAPEEFQLCNACQSLCHRRATFCPFCRNYGFEREFTAIVSMAKLLGAKELADECAILPREIKGCVTF